MLLLAVVFVSIWFYSRWVLFGIALDLHVFRRVLAAAVDYPPPPQPPAAAGVQGGVPALMSLHFKPAPTVSAGRRARQSYTASRSSAPSSLKGKEVAEVLNDRNFPAVDVKLLDDDESLGQARNDGRRNHLHPERAHRAVRHIWILLSLPQTQICTRKNWKTARDAGSAIVDLSYALEDEPARVVRSPWIERQLGQTPAFELQPGPCRGRRIPQPVALALLAAAGAEGRHSAKRAVATVFEPASEHGQKGMDELHEQTVNLLSFQPLPKNVFDTQVAFNMVASYGPNSRRRRWPIERRVLKHYLRITGKDASAPSLLFVASAHFSRPCVRAFISEFGAPADVESIAQRANRRTCES